MAEAVYQAFGLLSEAAAPATMQDQYNVLLEASASDILGLRKLVAPMIPAFAAHFAGQMDRILAAMLRLLEDSDASVRLEALRQLPKLRDAAPGECPRLTQILLQLLVSEVPAELQAAKRGLEQLFAADKQGVLTGIVDHIVEGNEETRAQAFSFLEGLLTAVSKSTNAQLDRFFAGELKRILADVTRDEFESVMKMLKSLSIYQADGCGQEMVDLLAEQAELDTAPQAVEVEFVDRLVACAKHAIPFLTKGGSGARFLSAVCQTVLPALESLDPKTESSVELLHTMTELAAGTQLTEEAAKQLLPPVYAALQAQLPAPPEGEVAAPSVGGDQEPKLNFSAVECLLATFHTLAQKSPGFLTSDEATLQSFRRRLQYFSTCSQPLMANLKKALMEAKKQKPTTESKARNDSLAVALRSTTNIQALVRDFFHNPPIYKASLVFSWKPQPKVTAGGAVAAAAIAAAVKAPAPAAKRPAAAEEGGDRKRSRPSQEVYHPPSGKFSTGMKVISDPVNALQQTAASAAAAAPERTAKRGAGVSISTGRGRGGGRGFRRGRGGTPAAATYTVPRIGQPFGRAFAQAAAAGIVYVPVPAPVPVPAVNVAMARGMGRGRGSRAVRQPYVNPLLR